jgi:hypothetical protein
VEINSITKVHEINQLFGGGGARKAKKQKEKTFWHVLTIHFDDKAKAMAETKVHA